KTAKIWDMHERSARPIVVPSNKRIAPPHFLLEGRQLLTFGEDGLCRAAPLANLTSNLPLYSACLAVSRDGSRSLTLSNPQYSVWTNTNRLSPAFTFRHDRASKFEFSPSGRFLISRSDRDVQVRDVELRTLLFRSADPRALINFPPSEDEVYLAVAEGDQ